MAYSTHQIGTTPGLADVIKSSTHHGDAGNTGQQEQEHCTCTQQE